MSFSRRRWRLLLLIIVVASVLAGYRLLDQATSILYYRIVDDRTILVGTESGHGAWVRVASATETPDTVIVTVNSLFVQLGPGTAEGIRSESVVNLARPIEARTVIDGSSGLPVERANCPPPAVFAPVCP